MEIGGKGSVDGNLANNSSFFKPKPPLTDIDKFLSSQNSFSCQKRLTSVQNQSTFVPPNLFSGISSSFSANKLPETDFVNVILPYAEATWNQDDVIGNSNEVKLASESFDPRENREKGQSNGYLIKGQWTEEEDGKLKKLVMQYGSKNWSVIAEKMGERAGKQCRERWLNHLRPDIKKDVWSEEEERLLIEVHKKIGNKWAEIAKHIAGRTENSIKNHWNAAKRRQISRRKIKKPRGVNGKRQSTLLEDYILSKYSNKGSGSTSTSTTIAPPSSEGQSFFTFETCEEEMYFMKNLFGNNDLSNNASITDKGKAVLYPSATSETNIQIDQDAFHYPNLLDAAVALNLNLPMNQGPSFVGSKEGDLMGTVPSCQFSCPRANR